MQYLHFYNGNKIPIVGLGTLQAEDPIEFEAAIDKALEIGYRHFDTAYLYKNEEILGRALSKWLDSGKIKREDLFITTKLPMIAMQHDRVNQFIKLSLAALKLDYIDLYLVHCPFGFTYINEIELVPKTHDGCVNIDKTTDLEAIWKSMEAQVDAGLTKSIGISNFSEKQIERIMKVARIPPANQQIEVNLYFQQPEMLATCEKYNITVVGYGPLGSPGRTAYYQKQGSNIDFKCPAILDDPVIAEISNKYNRTTAQIILRFLVQLNICPIPKSTNAERLKSNIQIFDFELSESDMLILKSLDKGEDGRSFTFIRFKGVSDHPEMPFPPRK